MIEKEKYQKKVGLFGKAGRDFFQYFHSLCSSQKKSFHTIAMYILRHW